MENLSAGNVNSYLYGIRSNASELNALASGLETNFFQAVQDRFIVSPTQATALSQMAPEQKTEIAHAFRLAANAVAARPESPVTITTSGFGEETPPTYSKISLNVDLGIEWTIGGGWTIDIGIHIEKT